MIQAIRPKYVGEVNQTLTVESFKRLGSVRKELRDGVITHIHRLSTEIKKRYAGYYVILFMYDIVISRFY